MRLNTIFNSAITDIIGDQVCPVNSISITSVPINTAPPILGISPTNTFQSQSVPNTNTNPLLAPTPTPIAPTLPPAKNRGRGAGGAGTNVAGLPMESATMVGDIDGLLRFTQSRLHAFMRGEGYFTNVPDFARAHGAKNPDEAFVNVATKTLVIKEVKVQNGGGSVVEKIQGIPMKRDNYREQYPGWDVVYILVASTWFRKNAVAELRFLEKNKVPVFIVDDPTDTKAVVREVICRLLLD